MPIEPSDVDVLDWAWFDRYAEQVEAELADVFAAAYEGMAPESPLAQGLAETYARNRGAELLRLDGDVNLIAQTRERVRTLVETTIREGESLQALRKNLRDDYIFSRARADVVARTETATALGQGKKAAALSQGRDEKRWVTQGDACPSCLSNEGEGWIPLGDTFPSGHDTIPAHPNCQCDVGYRTAEKPTALSLVAEARCPECDKMLGKDIIAARIKCPRCKTITRFGSEQVDKLARSGV